jgi:adenine-specific DNA-methyltransferase
MTPPDVGAACGRPRRGTFAVPVWFVLLAVIWRETEGWTREDQERDKKFVAGQTLTEGADDVFVNGDSFIPNVKALEPVFKARMFAPVEA